MKRVIEYIKKNPVLASAVSGLASLALKQGIEFIQDNIKVEIQTNNYGDQYQRLVAWMVDQQLLINSKKIGLDRNGNVSAPEGKVWFLYKKKYPAYVSIVCLKTDYDMKEVFTLVIYGGNRKMIDDIFAEVLEVETRNRTISIKTNEHGHWYNTASRLLRDEHTFILKPGQLDYILNDIEWFLTSKDWYRNRGIPYHRGYLFSGPPGTGKTTIISVIASKFHLPVCIINLASLSNDAELLKMVSNIASGSIIAFEDIDCLRVSNDRDTQKEKDKGVTLAGVLNALDGMATPDGVIFILTTNEPEKLDKALIRPGRVDVQEVFDLLKQEQQQELSQLFYDAPLKCVMKPLGASTLQNVFMKYPENPEAAQKELETL